MERKLIGPYISYHSIEWICCKIYSSEGINQVICWELKLYLKYSAFVSNRCLKKAKIKLNVVVWLVSTNNFGYNRRINSEHVKKKAVPCSYMQVEQFIFCRSSWSLAYRTSAILIHPGTWQSFILQWQYPVWTNLFLFINYLLPATLFVRNSETKH